MNMCSVCKSYCLSHIMNIAANNCRHLFTRAVYWNSCLHVNTVTYSSMCSLHLPGFIGSIYSSLLSSSGASSGAAQRLWTWAKDTKAYFWTHRMWITGVAFFWRTEVKGKMTSIVDMLFPFVCTMLTQVMKICEENSLPDRAERCAVLMMKRLTLQVQ